MALKGLPATHRLVHAAIGAAASLFCVCGQAQAAQTDPRDPLEAINRAVYSFNDVLDRALIRPVASAYVKAAPHWVRKGVTNFFGNVGDVWYAVNNAVTLKRQATGDSVGRVMINTTLGILGFIDVASEMNIENTPRILV